MIVEQLESRRHFSTDVTSGVLTWAPVTSGAVFTSIGTGNLRLTPGTSATIAADPNSSFKGSATLTKTGTLVITGTDDADRISIVQDGSKIKFDSFVNGATLLISVSASQIKRILVEAGAGNDKVFIDPIIAKPVTVSGGGGNDTIDGTSNCTLMGGAGNDHLYAPQTSVLTGGDGNDTLAGDRTDSLTGGAGHDVAIVVNPHPGIGASFLNPVVITNGTVDGQPLFADSSSIEQFKIDPSDAIELHLSNP